MYRVDDSLIVSTHKKGLGEMYVRNSELTLEIVEKLVKKLPEYEVIKLPGYVLVLKNIVEDSTWYGEIIGFDTLVHARRFLNREIKRQKEEIKRGKEKEEQRRKDDLKAEMIYNDKFPNAPVSYQEVQSAWDSYFQDERASYEQEWKEEDYKEQIRKWYKVSDMKDASSVAKLVGVEEEEYTLFGKLYREVRQEERRYTVEYRESYKIGAVTFGQEWVVLDRESGKIVGSSPNVSGDTSAYAIANRLEEEWEEKVRNDKAMSQAFRDMMQS